MNGVDRLANFAGKYIVVAVKMPPPMKPFFYNGKMTSLDSESIVMDDIKGEIIIPIKDILPGFPRSMSVFEMSKLTVKFSNERYSIEDELKKQPLNKKLITQYERVKKRLQELLFGA